MPPIIWIVVFCRLLANFVFLSGKMWFCLQRAIVNHIICIRPLDHLDSVIALSCLVLCIWFHKGKGDERRKTERSRDGSFKTGCTGWGRLPSPPASIVCETARVPQLEWNQSLNSEGSHLGYTGSPCSDVILQYQATETSQPNEPWHCHTLQLIVISLPLHIPSLPYGFPVGWSLAQTALQVPLEVLAQACKHV